MTTTIAKNTAVTLNYLVKDSDGELIDDGSTPLEYLHGGYEGIFEKIEAELEGKAVGFTTTVRLEPAEAFGEYDAELLQIESADLFPAEITVGMQFNGAPEGDENRAMVYTVTAIEDGKVVLDGNHPLAGVVMDFTCTVAAIRAATAEEVAHGHIHGSHGHPH